MKNSTYKKDRPQLSENQITQHKNFDATLKNVKPATPNAFLKSIKYWGTGGVATIVLVAAIYLLSDKTNIQQDSPEANFTYQPTNDVAKITAIKPPFANHDIAYEVFKIDCNKDEEITTKSGTKFNVPKNSLIDSEGNPITGTAEIHYRELRNPVDFFLSGIPMNYDSAGTTYTFESAGMLDIKAFQNDQPLALANNKTIDFEFSSTTNDSGFNFYSLNEETGIWSLENQAINPVITTQSNPIKPSSKLSESDTKKTVKPIAPIEQDTKKYSLNLKVDKSNYPELEKYEGTIFEINEINQKFDPVIYKIQWENAALSASNIKDNYTLKLTREDSSIYLTVYPVVKNAFYEKAITQYHKELKNYQESNSYDEFEAYDDYKYTSVSQEVNADVLRNFTIAGFGIYNCDTPQMQPNVVAKKNVLDKNNEPVKLGGYYVANTNRNSIASAYGNNKSNHIKYYKKGASIVWFVDENGLISIINPDQFKNINKIDHLSFEVFSPDQGIEVLRSLMAYK